MPIFKTPADKIAATHNMAEAKVEKSTADSVVEAAKTLERLKEDHERLIKFKQQQAANLADPLVARQAAKTAVPIEVYMNNREIVAQKEQKINDLHHTLKPENTSASYNN